jgi:hypothetical protein
VALAAAMRAPVRSLPAGLDQSYTIAAIEHPAILATPRRWNLQGCQRRP